MSITSDIVIIGGGASGLLCAVAASKKNKDKKIIILESEDRVGKKLLVSGNGRCNLTNAKATSKNYHGSVKELVDDLYVKYSPDYIINYFKELGLLTKVEKDGRVYPRSKLSSSVLNVIRNEIKKQNIEELCNINITDIKISENEFIIYTENEKVHAKKLVLATGGNSTYKGTLSDSSKITEILGYNNLKFFPSLSPVKVENTNIKSLNGIRHEGKVTLLKNNKFIMEETGEIQFTSDSLSGICVFNLSRIPNKEKDCIIRVSLLPELHDNEIKDLVLNQIEKNKDMTIDNLFTGMFHKNLSIYILKECSLSPSQKVNSLTNNDIDNIVYKINHLDFITLRRNDFRNSQVTSGGININEINSDTFESKKIKNLYIIGEALDIDGDCGGYNLQFAFASSLCVGDNI